MTFSFVYSLLARVVSEKYVELKIRRLYFDTFLVNKVVKSFLIE